MTGLLTLHAHTVYSHTGEAYSQVFYFINEDDDDDQFESREKD